MSITESLRYGASELKGFYNRNLGLALLVSVGLHLALIGLYLVTANVQAHDDPGHRDGGGVIVLPPFVQPPTEDPLVVQPPPAPPGPLVDPPTPVGTMADPFGIIVPVTDLIVTDSTSVAIFDNLGIASSQPGNGPGSGGRGDSGGSGIHGIAQPAPMNITAAEEIPSPEIFIPVEKDPEFDWADLKRRVKYPEIARRNGIEGSVVVEAFVDRNGRVARTRIVRSDNRIFERAAVEAVVATRFAPAEQNGAPIGVWMAIPIDFRLD